MSKLITGSINLSKIDKDKLFKAESGNIYLNINVWLNDEEDQYGNIASVQQSLTKEQRESGEKAVYIGNLKELKREEPKSDVIESDDLPF